MIIKVEMYAVKCDQCGQVGVKDSDYAAWHDELAAKEEAYDAGWTSDNGKEYCPDCYTYDDEDNLIIK